MKLVLALGLLSFAAWLPAQQTRTEVTKPTTPHDDSKPNSDQVPEVYAVSAQLERVVVLRFKYQADLLAVSLLSTSGSAWSPPSWSFIGHWRLPSKKPPPIFESAGAFLFGQRLLECLLDSSEDLWALLAGCLSRNHPARAAQES